MSKRALLVGINYVGTSSALSGCINDVLQVKEVLLTKGYTEENLELMTDETTFRPTRKNILQALLNLLLSEATTLYFHYSGHGSSVHDTNGDEADGKDETLVPLDYTTEGLILDDELRGLIQCLKPTQHLFVVLDCCHSGTGLDLRYNLYQHYGSKTLKMVEDAHYEATRGSVVMISGCQDAQTSADAYIAGKFQGALTYSFLTALKDGSVKTYEQLIQKIRKILKEGKYAQLPNLAAGKELRLGDFYKF